MGQLAVTIALSLLLVPLGWQSAASALVGGGIALVFMPMQLWGLLRPYRAQNPGAIFGAMLYVAAVKFLLGVGLFALAFKGLPWLVPWAVFVGFIISYLAPFLVMHQRDSRLSPRL